MPERDEAVAEGRRSRFGADLRAVLAERDFRKLFAARLVSQTGDGVFNASGTTWNVFLQGGSGNNILIGGAAHGQRQTFFVELSKQFANAGFGNTAQVLECEHQVANA